MRLLSVQASSSASSLQPDASAFDKAAISPIFASNGSVRNLASTWQRMFEDQTAATTTSPNIDTSEWFKTDKSNQESPINNNSAALLTSVNLLEPVHTETGPKEEQQSRDVIHGNGDSGLWSTQATLHGSEKSYDFQDTLDCDTSSVQEADLSEFVHEDEIDDAVNAVVHDLITNVAATLSTTPEVNNQVEDVTEVADSNIQETPQAEIIPDVENNIIDSLVEEAVSSAVVDACGPTSTPRLVFSRTHTQSMPAAVSNFSAIQTTSPPPSAGKEEVKDEGKEPMETAPADGETSDMTKGSLSVRELRARFSKPRENEGKVQNIRRKFEKAPKPVKKWKPVQTSAPKKPVPVSDQPPVPDARNNVAVPPSAPSVVAEPFKSVSLLRAMFGG